MYIDLTIPLTEQAPVYPGDPATKIQPAGVMKIVGFNDHYVSMGTHAGTHIDAPMHMVENGRNLGQIPVGQFIGRGIYVKVNVNNFDLVKEAGIQEGDIVLFHTGMSDNYSDPGYFENYPAMPAEIAQFLVDTKVKMVGLDTCSADNQDGFPVHKILLGGNVLIIENLVNLEKLAGKEFTIYALPINLQIDGAPSRVIAEIK